MTELIIEHLQDLWLIDFLWLPAVWSNCSFKNWFMENKCIIKARSGTEMGVDWWWGDRRREHNIQRYPFVVNVSGNKYSDDTCSADSAGYYRHTWAGVARLRKMCDYSLSEFCSFVCLNFVRLNSTVAIATAADYNAEWHLLVLWENVKLPQ